MTYRIYIAYDNKSKSKALKSAEKLKKQGFEVKELDDCYECSKLI